VLGKGDGKDAGASEGEGSMSRKKISTTIYITPEQDEELKRLSSHTKVPVAEYIRLGIELVLAKLEDKIPPAHPFLIGEPRRVRS
jgi:hypothetical protein